MPFSRAEQRRGARPELGSGGSYVIENVLFKVAYPAEFHGQTAVEAALTVHAELRRRGASAADIARVTVRTHEASLLNLVSPGASLLIGKVSEHDGRGRHTTTAAELVRLVDGPAEHAASLNLALAIASPFASLGVQAEVSGGLRRSGPRRDRAAGAP